MNKPTYQDSLSTLLAFYCGFGVFFFLYQADVVLYNNYREIKSPLLALQLLISELS